MLITRLGSFVVGLFLVFVCIACDRTPPTAPLAQLDVTPRSMTLLEGRSAQLSVHDTGALVKWSSSAPGIASVDSTGIVSGIKAGSAQVTARTDSGVGATTIEVVAARTSLTGKIDTNCALTAAGELYCWGYNGWGQMGAGGGIARTPIRSGGGMTFNDAVAASFEHSCGISSGATYCWGFNSRGNIGDGSTRWKSYAPSLVRPQGFVKVDVNGGTGDVGAAYCGDALCFSKSCGLTAEGQAFCWGDNVDFPTAVAGSVKFADLRVGFTYQCGLSADRLVYCWGGDAYKQSGGGGAAPSLVDVGDPVQEVSANHAHTCAVTIEGFVYCWGSNASGQLGAPTSESCFIGHFPGGLPCRGTPARVITDQLFQSVSVGSTTPEFIDFRPASHTCGVTTSLEIYCWGSNVAGQLGNGTLVDSDRPVRVASEEKFARVVAGRYHTCALTVAGVAYCWGSNGDGQLGNGMTTSSSVPVRVAGDLIFR